MSATGQFAIVTGASTGIGFELARRCADEGFDLLIAADEPAIEKAAAALRQGGRKVQAIEVDLSTTDGVDKLYAAAAGGLSMHCSPMPEGVWATRSSIRISPARVASSTPT
jgi:NAD(P)-dependent dehydrogenase (short-subunit alcohol dehydrogenase family)